MPRTKEPKMVKIAVSLNQELLERLDRYAEEHLEDRSTALRQLLDFALNQKQGYGVGALLLTFLRRDREPGGGQ